MLYLLANVAYVVTLTLDRDPARPAGPGRHGRDAGDPGRAGRDDHGRRDPDLDVRLRERPGPGRGAGLLRDGPRRPLLRRASATTNRHHVPAVALVAQGLWAALLVLPVTVTTRSGDRRGSKYGNLYNELLEYIIPVDVTFYTLMVGAVIALAAQGTAT